MFSKYFVLLVIAFAACDRCTGESVREVELTSEWSVQNQNFSISVKDIKLPSGVYSALYGEEVLLTFNDLHMRWIGYDNWTYTKHFSVSQAEVDNAKFVNLTFHGVDTISRIYLNGYFIGETDNMFVRYSFNVRPYLKADNILEVVFKSPVWHGKYLSDALEEKGEGVPPYCPELSYKGECHVNMLRKMQASFSWDWGLAAPSMGLWKPVVLEFYEVALIRDIDVVTWKNSTHWLMDIRVFLDTGIKQNFYGELTFYAVELLTTPVTISFSENPIPYDNPVVAFTQAIPIEHVIKWWPNGYGLQKLYPLHFTMNAWLDSDGPKPRQRTISQKSLRVGFRTIELVEEELENGNSFYFKVNDEPIFMKGSNFIPSHILPEYSYNQATIKNLLTSAQEAHTNMIRIWGGGLYESDYFYDMADYLGILVWQDALFACAMYPTYNRFLESVRTEINQNAKRLAHHPSMAIFATNNENEAALVNNWYGTAPKRSEFEKAYRQLYVGTVAHEFKIVAHSSRPETLISSPSNGIKEVEDNYISANPGDPNYGDVHFYEIYKDTWNANLYPRTRFASEYGFQSLPALGAWKRIIGKDDNLYDIINHRQHHVAGMAVIMNPILMHLPSPYVDPDMEATIYLSQIAQAMSLKVETELYRSQRDTEYRTMGALYWQLNDIWIAPSWAAIDFFGNWKIVHHWLTDFMAPVSIIALYDSDSDAVNVTLVRDSIEKDVLEATVTMNIFHWSNLYPQHSISWEAELKPNTAQLNKVIPVDQIFSSKYTAANSFVQFVLSDKSSVISRTYYFPTSFKNVQGIGDPSIKLEISSMYCLGTKNSYSIAVKVSQPAVFVYLEVTHSDVKQYRLSNNGFLQLEPIQIIQLEFQSKKCVSLTVEDIKVQTVNQYMYM